MSSVFTPIDSNLEGNFKFWMPYNQPDTEEILTETLYEVTKKQIFKENSYTLTTSVLIKNSEHKKVSPIEWKFVQPFTEENDKNIRYGFTLGLDEHSQDFYVSCKEKLDKWLDCLSSTCIMSGIENDFSIVKRIGKGKSAEVYLAISNENSQKYAIKAIEKATLNAQSMSNLIEEIKIMRSLNHPNILKLHRVYESDSHIYLVLDYFEEGDLYSRIIKKKNFTEAAVAKFSQKLFEVLEYLDSKNIVHRDIKLENILMVSNENDYDFKLADFGLASKLGEGLTQICGSPGYIAPEILNRFSYGTKADVFSAGAVIYILLSGSMPFYGREVKQIIISNREAKINFHQKVWETISSGAVNFLQNIMDPRPSFRVSASEALKHPWFKTQNFEKFYVEAKVNSKLF
ncbi:unnamed protein product [Blepharisma stoltei]|uniref:Protein kinase domain-containing protein n=1 Tax=Blepharisma stoltei TaxID=1481888 RepID=A0AAU9K2K9_9CILI|nr:unnamed protein product [Blepharisma stoltei]